MASIARRLGVSSRAPFQTLSVCVLRSLLESSTARDAEWLWQCFCVSAKNGDDALRRIGEVLFCRSVSECNAISSVFARRFADSLSVRVQKLCSAQRRHTLSAMFREWLEGRRDEKVADVAVAAEFVRAANSKSRKKMSAEEKENLVLFLMRGDEFVRALNAQTESALIPLIARRFGAKSTAGKSLQTRVQFALSPHRHFAQRIRELLSESDRNINRKSDRDRQRQFELLQLFLSRFQVDLDAVRRAFDAEAKERNATDLHRTLKLKANSNSKDSKAHGHSATATYFLLKLLTHSKRFEAHHDEDRDDDDKEEEEDF